MLTSLSARQVFEHEDIESMTKDQRKFAEQQLRNIFSHEMSKVSVSLTHKKRVSSKLLRIQQEKQEHLRKTYQRLNQRMKHVDSKRQQNIKQRISSCRNYDERWQNKIAELSNKIRRENREAEDRVRQLQKDYDQYLNKKQQRQSEINQKRSSLPSPNASFHSDQRRYGHVKVNATARDPIAHRPPYPNRSYSKQPNRLNLSIRDHQQKRSQLQEDKQKDIFQKALFRLETINQRRKRLINSQHQKSRSKELNQQRREPLYRSNTRLQKTNRKSPQVKQLQRSLFSQRKHSKGQFDHISVKRLRQNQQFLQRGEILHKHQQRAKRQHILKQIRQKVTEYKIVAQRSNAYESV